MGGPKVGYGLEAFGARIRVELVGADARKPAPPVEADEMVYGHDRHPIDPQKMGVKMGLQLPRGRLGSRGLEIDQDGHGFARQLDQGIYTARQHERFIIIPLLGLDKLGLEGLFPAQIAAEIPHRILVDDGEIPQYVGVDGFMDLGPDVAFVGQNIPAYMGIVHEGLQNLGDTGIKFTVFFQHFCLLNSIAVDYNRR